MKNISFLLAALVLLTQSCTIQKRQHLPGYHIEWNSNESHSEVQKASKEQGEDAPVVMNESALVEEPVLKEEAIVHINTEIQDNHPTNQPKLHDAQVKIDNQTKAHRLTFPSIMHSPSRLFFGGINPDDKPRTDGMSIAAMVCGIVGVLVPGTGVILSILAIIFGGIGMGRTSRNTELKGKGMAITGLVLGIVGVLLTVLLLAILSLSFGFAI